MKKYGVLILCSSFVLLNSFQCEKRTVNNSILNIQGQLLDSNSDALANFQLFYITYFEFDTIVIYNSEKLFSTNENGYFSVHVPEPNNYHQDGWKSGKLIIGFLDTTLFYQNNNLLDTIKSNFILLKNFSINSQVMNLGSLTIEP